MKTLKPSRDTRAIWSHTRVINMAVWSSKELKEGSKLINSVTNLVTGTNSLEEIKFECFHFLKT